jgi:tagaturonate epimerase
MITLNCPTFINTTINLSDVYTERYLNRNIKTEDNILQFSETELKKALLIYQKALDFAREVYDNYYRDRKEIVNFEISIDETATPNNALEHIL